jgi:hypothetical protein
MKTVNSTDIVAVRETHNIDEVNEWIHEGFKIWGKPHKCWVKEECRHLIVYTLVLLQDKKNLFRQLQKLERRNIPAKDMEK